MSDMSEMSEMRHVGQETPDETPEGFVVMCECGHKSVGQTAREAYNAHAWHGTHAVLEADTSQADTSQSDEA